MPQQEGVHASAPQDWSSPGQRSALSKPPGWHAQSADLAEGADPAAF